MRPFLAGARSIPSRIPHNVTLGGTAHDARISRPSPQDDVGNEGRCLLSVKRSTHFGDGYGYAQSSSSRNDFTTASWVTWQSSASTCSKSLITSLRNRRSRYRFGGWNGPGPLGDCSTSDPFRSESLARDGRARPTAPSSDLPNLIVVTHTNYSYGLIL
jgi:hypothetical protein